MTSLSQQQTQLRRCRSPFREQGDTNEALMAVIHTQWMCIAACCFAGGERSLLRRAVPGFPRLPHVVQVGGSPLPLWDLGNHMDMRYKQCYDMNTALPVNKELENGSIELNGNKAFVVTVLCGFEERICDELHCACSHPNKEGSMA